MAIPISSLQPALGLTQYITNNGILPTRGDGSGLDGAASGWYTAVVHNFAGNFAPGGVGSAVGTTLSIAGNTGLFSLLGTQFGGNGVNTFALPDLRAKLTESVLTSGTSSGVASGAASLTLTQAQLPASSGGTATAVSDVQPTITMQFGIAVSGVFPNPGSSGTLPNSIGTILQFAGNFMPAGYMRAEGQLLETTAYNALFSLIGTTFGGDGINNFRLPDLRDKVILGAGNGFNLGATLGADSDTITQANMPNSMGGSGAPIDSRQASIVLNQVIALTGIFPSRDSGSNDEEQPYIGEIITIAHNTIPDGYALADGRLLPIIQQNAALFALLGTTYGGNGTTNFALPNLTGRATTNVGTDPVSGLEVSLGQVVGSDSFTITSANIPALNIVGTVSGENFWGGDDADRIAGGGGNDSLVGNAGNDTIDGGSGDDTMDGGAGGSDTASFASVSESVFYGLLSQGTGFNTRGTGVDTLINFENLIGSSLADTLGGDTGANTLDGAGGDDTLYGWIGDDRLLGGTGNDVLDGGAGNDTMLGGAGNDTYVVDSGGDTVTELAGEGTVDVAFVTISSWAASANLEGVYLIASATLLGGSTGNDVLVTNATLASTLSGNAGDDTLWGQAGNDSLNGGAGNDVLRGGAGNDVLNGGTGDDQLVGGAGADVFRYDARSWGYDQVFDFVIGEDRIDMAGSAVSFAQITVRDAGGGTVVELFGSRIDVYGVLLTQSDFLFA